MTPRKRSGKNWEVQVVACKDLQLLKDGTTKMTTTRDSIDKLLDAVAVFADEAGQKLNAMDVCPSELTIEGHVSIDVGGGVLLFGVETGISVSMTWTFEQTWSQAVPHIGKRPLEIGPPKPPKPPKA